MFLRSKVVLVVGVLALITSACGTGTVEISPITTAPSTPNETVLPPEIAAVTTTLPPTTTQGQPTPRTVPTSESLGTGSPDEPLAVYELFGYEYWDTTWEGTAYGLVETSFGWFNEEGTCLVVLGSITPTVVDGFVSDAFDTPSIALLSDGKLIESSSGECDVEAVEEAGYELMWEANVTPGTSFAFYSEFYFADSVIPNLDLLIVGDPSTDDAIYYSPTTLTEIPTPDRVVGLTASDLGELLPVGPGSQFLYDEWGPVWTGSVEGLVGTELGFFADSGTCVAVVGTFIPTELDAGLVSDPFSVPDVGLLVDGHLIDGAFGECDTEPLEIEGYGWSLDAEVTQGTEYLFYQEFYFTSDELPEIDAIVIGSAGNEGAYLYEATVIRP